MFGLPCFRREWAHLQLWKYKLIQCDHNSRQKSGEYLHQESSSKNKWRTSNWMWRRRGFSRFYRKGNNNTQMISKEGQVWTLSSQSNVWIVVGRLRQRKAREIWWSSKVPKRNTSTTLKKWVQKGKHFSKTNCSSTSKWKFKIKSSSVQSWMPASSFPKCIK